MLKLSDLENAIEKYGSRKLHSVLPFGYIPGKLVEGGDPYLAYPDPAVLQLLDEALDQLDMGNSYKVASDWLNEKLKEHYKDTPDGENKHDYLSIMGVKRLWDYYRPDHPKKNYTPPKPLLLDDPNVKLSRKEKSLLRKKRELTENRRKLTIAKTAVKRQEAQLANRKEKLFKRYGKGKETEVQVIKLYEVGPAPVKEEKVVDVKANDDDFIVPDIPEDQVFFRPNPGPQEDFLAADEREVLYGGSAGGEPKSWFLPPPFTVRYQNKYRELLEGRKDNQQPSFNRKVIEGSETIPKGSTL